MAIDTIGTNAITNDAVNAAKIAAGAVDADITAIPDGSVTTAKIADDAVTSAKLYAENLGRRNLIINGGMQVAQRSTSATGLGASSGYFSVDRFRIFSSGTAGRVTMSQSSDTPNGFGNSLKIDVTTADTSIASSELFILSYGMEGQDAQMIKKGTSEAESLTVSFYAKANASANYVVEMYDNDN